MWQAIWIKKRSLFVHTVGSQNFRSFCFLPFFLAFFLSKIVQLKISREIETYTTRLLSFDTNRMNEIPENWQCVVLTLLNNVKLYCLTNSNLHFFNVLQIIMTFTGKSFSEALILASTNPQYDKRLLIELRVHWYMKTTSSEHVVYTMYTCWACSFLVLNS